MQYPVLIYHDDFDNLKVFQHIIPDIVSATTKAIIRKDQNGNYVIIFLDVTGLTADYPGSSPIFDVGSYNADSLCTGCVFKGQ